MTIGIYCLYYENADEQFYIGKSTHIESRYTDHCKMLNNDSHYNTSLLQLYKGIAPSLSIVELCSADMLNSREIYWISEFDSFNYGMNETLGGDGASYGAANTSALYTKEIYVDILKSIANTEYTFKEIAMYLNVGYTVVKLMALGTSHRYLELEYPVEYSLLLSKIGTRRKGVCNYKEEVYARILKLLAHTDSTLDSIAKNTLVPISIVKDISRGVSHLYLKEAYPIDYSILDGKRSIRKMKTHTRPKLLSPTGEVFSIQVGDIARFARDNGLNHGHLCSILNGIRKTHKGWKVYDGH